MQYYPMGHRPRKLSVIGAMKDIQDYKIAKARADEAPTLVERARLQLEHDKKALPLDLKLKSQAVAEGDSVLLEW